MEIRGKKMDPTDQGRKEQDDGWPTDDMLRAVIIMAMIGCMLMMLALGVRSAYLYVWDKETTHFAESPP